MENKISQNQLFGLLINELSAAGALAKSEAEYIGSRKVITNLAKDLLTDGQQESFNIWLEHNEQNFVNPNLKDRQLTLFDIEM